MTKNKEIKVKVTEEEFDRTSRILDMVDKLDDAQAEKFEAFMRQKVYGMCPENGTPS